MMSDTKAKPRARPAEPVDVERMETVPRGALHFSLKRLAAEGITMVSTPEGFALMGSRSMPNEFFQEMDDLMRRHGLTDPADQEAVTAFMLERLLWAAVKEAVSGS